MSDPPPARFHRHFRTRYALAHLMLKTVFQQRFYPRQLSYVCVPVWVAHPSHTSITP
jgi:hypothetical protein